MIARKHHIIKYISNRYLKALKLLMLFIIISTSGFAQKKREKERILSINPGIVMIGYADNYGFGNEISYQSSLSRRFFIRENIGSWLIDESSGNYYHHYTGIDASAEIGYALFKGKKRSFNLSIGPNIMYLIYRGHMESYKAKELGLQYVVSYQSRLGKYIYINTRIVHKRYPNNYANILYSIGIGVNLDCIKQ